MSVQEQIDDYIDEQPLSKREEMQALHRRILGMAPDCKLWFLDGRDERGKVVTNPNIGYGSQAVTYADGRTKEFYQVGLSANTGGLSVYVMGLPDKRFLSDTFGAKLGKAKVTGYCIKFRSTRDLNLEVLDEVIATGMGGR